MPRTQVDERTISYLKYQNASAGRRHHTHDEEMYQYELMRAGDPRAVDESVRVLNSGLPGHISDDPVRNQKYLFVASITIATRFAIEGGMDAEDAYNASDLYILKMDRLQSVDEVKALHKDMFEFFTAAMARVASEHVYSKQVVRAQDYIRFHLGERLNVADMAAELGVNASYLSTLFRRETGLTITDYVAEERVATAKNMLRFSNMSGTEIAEALGFSSQSYFTRTFRERTGYTPTQYRKRYFRDSEMGKASD